MELLVAAAVIMFSIGLGLAAATSVLSLVLSCMASGLRRTAFAAAQPTGEFAYELPTLGRLIRSRRPISDQFDRFRTTRSTDEE